jgi:replicative superfamily II helicase
MPAAHQRSAICSLRQRFTLAERSRQISIMDSTQLVDRSVRASVGGTPRRPIVNVSSSSARNPLA